MVGPMLFGAAKAERFGSKFSKSVWMQALHVDQQP